MPYDFSHINLYTFPTLLAMLINLALAILVFFKNPQKPLNRSFAWWCMIVVLHTFGAFTWYLSSNFAVADISQKILNIGLILMPPAFLGFIFTFTVANKAKRFLPGLYFISFLFILSSLFTSYFIKEVYFTGGPFYYKLTGGILYYLYIVYFDIAALAAVFLLSKKIREGNKDNSNRIVYLSIAIVVGAFLCTINMIMICFSQEFDTASYIGVSLYALVLAYSIFKHNLLDISVVIRKGLVYSILTALLSGLVVLMILLGERLFRGIMGYNSIWTIIISVFVVALIVQPLREGIQRGVDRVFFKRKYNYQKTLKDLSHSAINVADVTQLLGFVVRTVKSVLQVNKADVYLLDPKKDEFVLRGEGKNK